MPVNNGQRSQGGSEDAGFLPAWVWNEQAFPALQSLMAHAATDAPAQPAGRPQGHPPSHAQSSVLQQLRLLYESRLTLRDAQRSGDRPSDDEQCPFGGEEDEEMEEDPPSSSDEDIVALEGPNGYLGLRRELPEFSRPPPCAFLRPGQVFRGRQRMPDALQRQEDWQVAVTIHGYDPAAGKLVGTIEASNVPNASGPILTWLEGEVVDNANATFFTRRWGASEESDLDHWDHFDGFRGCRRAVVRSRGRLADLAARPYLFMRWKEVAFLPPSTPDCGLTIAGFYYVCLDRVSGSLCGYYYDPASTPYQELTLQPSDAQGGRLHCEYELC